MNSSLLIIKLVCILSLLFVSASAGLFDGGFFGGGDNNEDKNKNGKNDEDSAAEGGLSGGIGKGLLPGLKLPDLPKLPGLPELPGLPKIPWLPGFGGRNNNDEETQQQPEAQPGNIAETDYRGKFKVVQENSGVSAMHLQLMPNNKAIMFDATSLGRSDIQLLPGNCRQLPRSNDVDCFSHSVEYDIVTNQVRVLKVMTDPWCSSGGLSPDGTLVSTGGWADGEKSIRYLKPDGFSDWEESEIKLADKRWYSTQVLLADGRFAVFGGRRGFSYEFLAPEGEQGQGRIKFPFFRDTTDLYENNLYPFIHMAPNGNLFIMANFKSVLLDVNNNKILRQYPDLPGGARNYPGSACSAMLPVDLKEKNTDIEVIVCGGGNPLAFGKAEKEGLFLPALDTCGRIKVLEPNSNWEMERMPSARIMSDMLNLPNGELLILNGAKKGASGWGFADEPVQTPFLYNPNKPNGQRFKVLQASTIPRMYHSTSAVLPDATILVAGSNTNDAYTFKGVKFPTELRVEKFEPPYLDPELGRFRPKNVFLQTRVASYGNYIQLTFTLNSLKPIAEEDIKVTMYLPPFTTHGYSMNQRLVILPISQFNPGLLGGQYLTVEAPAKPEQAPPGYYLLFVNYKGVPSTASWIQLEQ